MDERRAQRDQERNERKRDSPPRSASRKRSPSPSEKRERRPDNSRERRRDHSRERRRDDSRERRRERDRDGSRERRRRDRDSSRERRRRYTLHSFLLGTGVWVHLLFVSMGCLQLLEILEVNWNLISLLEILEISWNLIGFPGKLQNVGGKAGIYAVLVSWLADGTVMSVGRSSSSHAQLEIACRRNIINQAVTT